MIDLVHALERLPPRLLIIGIEASGYETGTSPSAAVEAAADELVAELAGC